MTRGLPSNYRLKLPARPVTCLAFARPAPGPPAGYRVRWADRLRDGRACGLMSLDLSTSFLRPTWPDR